MTRLDAFNDILRGGFGTPENSWVLRRLDSESSRTALGYEATMGDQHVPLTGGHATTAVAVGSARVR